MTARRTALSWSLAALLAAASGLSAEEVPGWLPAEIVLPEQHRIVRTTEVGSTNRLMLVELPEDAEDTVLAWREALEAAGYAVDSQPEVSGDRQFTFSGPQIRTGQVVLMPGSGGEVSLVQIDATLDP